MTLNILVSLARIAYQSLSHIIGRTAKHLGSCCFPKDYCSLLSRLETTQASNARVIDAIPQILVDALVFAEDHRYFLHEGLDPIAMIRAIWRRMVHGSREGGSTIEQQLWRTLTGERELTVRRKVREVLLAPLLGRMMDKQEMARTYLTIGYFGWRMNGLHQACGRLGYDLASLNQSEAADIVARLKYPEPRWPSCRRLLQIRARRNYIVQRWNYLMGVKGGNKVFLGGEDDGSFRTV